LTYVYADSTAVLGPLAMLAEPHSYDLCDVHSERLTAPRGWEVVRLAPRIAGPPPDDLSALVDALREDVPRVPYADPSRSPESGGEAAGMVETNRRGHLRVLRPADSPAVALREPQEPQRLQGASVETP
jgi:hypothetical protein